MTKKSSFLRQLNLYGFNRLTRLGPDHASYYHENFLRGMKFLCRRMHRQKVNGNGIRAAGNPDDEPDFFKFPPCPPTLKLMQEHHFRLTLLAPSLTPSPIVSTVSLPHKEDVVNSINMATPAFSDPASSCDPLFGNAPGQQVSFPLKLQRILDKLEAEGNTDVISWLPHGRAFIVHDSHRFVSELMPHWFNQSKYSSFQRQLHMYNFQRITAPGRDKGAYHHPSFLRGRPQLAQTMRRTRVNGKGTRRPGNPEVEPDFYSLEPVPGIVPGAQIEIPVDGVVVVGGGISEDHSYSNKEYYVRGLDRGVDGDEDSHEGYEGFDGVAEV
jgi:hypothetical protein